MGRFKALATFIGRPPRHRNPPRYVPHQGTRERARRLRQLAEGRLRIQHAQTQNARDLPRTETPAPHETELVDGGAEGRVHSAGGGADRGPDKPGRS